MHKACSRAPKTGRTCALVTHPEATEPLARQRRTALTRQPQDSKTPRQVSSRLRSDTRLSSSLDSYLASGATRHDCARV